MSQIQISTTCTFNILQGDYLTCFYASSKMFRVIETEGLSWSPLKRVTTHNMHLFAAVGNSAWQGGVDSSIDEVCQFYRSLVATILPHAVTCLLDPSMKLALHVGDLFDNPSIYRKVVGKWMNFLINTRLHLAFAI